MVYNKNYFKIINEKIKEVLLEKEDPNKKEKDKINKDDYIKHDKQDDINQSMEKEEDLNKTSDITKADYDAQEPEEFPENEIREPQEEYDYNDFDGINDADYLNQNQEVIDDFENEIEKFNKINDGNRKVLIHEYFEELYENVRRMIKAVDEINTQLVDDNNKLNTLFLYKDALKEIERKIKKYVVENATETEYDSFLYVYILLRTEFATTIRLIRKLLDIKDKENDD